ITLVILLLAAILIFRLSKILTRPLYHLMERAEHISKGHFSGRAITFPTTDEIGRLANAMNDMERHLREGAQERSRLLRHI
ncbi:HAMP domain-containing protein, partial [Proteus mirabilis]|uniref:HAMP domain-containing protein n=1 Tax=Proteus mirabilis TaxID=584 RepID=UPI0025783A2E